MVSAPTLGTYAGKRLFTSGTVVAGATVLANQFDYSQIYKSSNGHLYRLDLTTVGSPTAIQVSSESNATTDDLCSLNGVDATLGTDVNYLAEQAYNDFANPQNSSYFYRLPGPDGICNTNDDVVFMAKLGMAAGDAPILARMPLAVVHNPTTGAITGFIVNESADLAMYDANFQNHLVLVTPASPITTAYALANSGFTATGGLFVIDGDIVHVDYATGTASASLFTVPNWTATTRFSNSASLTTLYFSVDTSDRTQHGLLTTARWQRSRTPPRLRKRHHQPSHDSSRRHDGRVRSSAARRYLYHPLPFTGRWPTAFGRHRHHDGW
jgi:hypothetical protein